MIKLEGIHTSYPVGKHPLHVLKGIDVYIEKGELVSIIGSSGSGKSTLLNILGILYTHDTGKYFLADNLIHNLTEKKGSALPQPPDWFCFLVILPFELKKTAECRPTHQILTEENEGWGLGGYVWVKWWNNGMKDTYYSQYSNLPTPLAIGKINILLILSLPNWI